MSVSSTVVTASEFFKSIIGNRKESKFEIGKELQVARIVLIYIPPAAAFH